MNIHRQLSLGCLFLSLFLGACGDNSDNSKDASFEKWAKRMKESTQRQAKIGRATTKLFTRLETYEARQQPSKGRYQLESLTTRIQFQDRPQPLAFSAIYTHKFDNDAYVPESFVRGPIGSAEFAPIQLQLNIPQSLEVKKQQQISHIQIPEDEIRYFELTIKNGKKHKAIIQKDGQKSAFYTLQPFRDQRPLDDGGTLYTTSRKNRNHELQFLQKPGKLVVILRTYPWQNKDRKFKKAFYLFYKKQTSKENQ